MALDAGWAGVLGALIGAGATLGASALSPVVTNWRANSLADKRRSRLRGMLGGQKFKWRSIDALAASIGADEATTTALLIEIDARASFSNPRSWALVSRVPWPDDLQPVD